MAKETEDDITFDKLQNLNLNVESHIPEIEPKPKEEEKSPKSEKKRGVGRKPNPISKKETIKTSFKIDKDLHLSLKQYSLLRGKDMADIVFEEVLKPFLEKKGFYPPKKL